jgi:predicted AlkP superfamily pyrophosphatase or phosphodiesterase
MGGRPGEVLLEIRCPVPCFYFWRQPRRSLAPAADPPPGSRPADHVVVVGLDGCRPEAIPTAAGPTLEGLLGGTAWAWAAKAAHPTVTHVTSAGILTGCTPDKQGVADKA